MPTYTSMEFEQFTEKFGSLLVPDNICVLSDVCEYSDVMQMLFCSNQQGNIVVSGESEMNIILHVEGIELDSYKGKTFFLLYQGTLPALQFFKAS